MKYMLYAAAAVVATLFAPAEAQQGLRERDALVRWYGDPGCPGGTGFVNNTRTGREGFQTYVVAVQGVCQRVPNAASFLGYRVNCGITGGSGALQFCQDAGCGDCPIITPFQKDQCLPNDKELFGSASVAVLCPDENGPEIPAPETQQELFADEFLVRWFTNPGCAGQEDVFSTERTIVVGSQGICHRVPNAPGNAGYKVNCNADGTGDITYCSDTNCNSCSITAPFERESCLPNDVARFGSASYTVTCPGPNARRAPGSTNDDSPVVSQPGGDIVSSGAESYSMAMTAGALMATALYWAQ